jgi:hypothetical protein
MIWFKGTSTTQGEVCFHKKNIISFCVGTQNVIVNMVGGITHYLKPEGNLIRNLTNMMDNDNNRKA